MSPTETAGAVKPLGPSPTPTADRPAETHFPDLRATATSGRYTIPTLTLTELTQPALTNTSHNQPHMVQPARPTYARPTDRPRYTITPTTLTTAPTLVHASLGSGTSTRSRRIYHNYQGAGSRAQEPVVW